MAQEGPKVAVVLSGCGVYPFSFCCSVEYQSITFFELKGARWVWMHGGCFRPHLAVAGRTRHLPGLYFLLLLILVLNCSKFSLLFFFTEWKVLWVLRAGCRPVPCDRPHSLLLLRFWNFGSQLSKLLKANKSFLACELSEKTRGILNRTHFKVHQTASTKGAPDETDKRNCLVESSRISPTQFCEGYLTVSKSRSIRLFLLIWTLEPLVVTDYYPIQLNIARFTNVN